MFLKELNNSNKKVEESNNDKGKPKLWDSSKNKLWEWVELIFRSGGVTLFSFWYKKENVPEPHPKKGFDKINEIAMLQIKILGE